jgi:hypothetical protein
MFFCGETALPCYPIKIVARVLASSRIIELYHPSGETALPCYPIKIAVRVLPSSRIIELWFEAW